MTRWFFGTLAVMIVGSVLMIVVARLFGRPGTKGAALFSVISQWLAAYVLWSFAGGLARRHGFLEVYEPTIFAVIALIGGAWHYRTLVRGSREQGRVVFVGGQLVWIVILMFQNGVFRN